MTDEFDWRLDALDPIAGLGFASRRSSDLEADRLDTNAPSVFIGPPTFQPIGVRSRAVGIAAARHSFQAGLFFNGEEVGFKDLDDVIAFVRRCYQNGGGGVGGGAGSGGGPPPAPLEPAPELPPAAGEGIDGEGRSAEGPSIMKSLRSDLRLYRDLQAELKGQLPGKSFPARWSRPLKAKLGTGSASLPGLHSTDGADVLLRGAVRVVAEMLKRRPNETQDLSDRIYWQGCWNRLVLIIHGMGLGGLFSRQYIDYLLLLASSTTLKTMGDPSQDLGVQQTSSLELVGQIILRPYSHWGSIGARDALDDLHSWPARTSASRRSAPPAHPENRSLLHLISVFLSVPPVEGDAGSIDADIELALFAAARIVLTGSREIQAFLDPPYPNVLEWARELALRRATEIADVAWDWLADQLPKRGFTPSLEQAISSTATLTYA